MAAGGRLLFLLTDAFGGFGGIAQYNRDVLNAIETIGEVRIVDAIPRAVSEDVGTLPSKLRYHLGGVGSVARYLRTAFRIGLTGPRPDAVICGHINLLPLAWAIARLRRAPLMLLVFGIDVWKPARSGLASRLARHVDCVASISQVTIERMRSWCPVPDERIAILPNAITPEAYGAGPKAQDLVDLHGLAGKRVAMTLGRIAADERMKGFDERLEAMPALLERHPDLVYLVAGDGDDRARLEAKAADLGIAAATRFAGRIPEERKADYFRLADVYAMPSRGEGFGFVFIEALACGTPVVAGRFDGGFEAIMGGKLGLAVDPDDSAAIVDAVSRQLDAPREVPADLFYFAFPNFAERFRNALKQTVRLGRS
jgi:glycosyltransferase involved in cell wall biosynthesis